MGFEFEDQEMGIYAEGPNEPTSLRYRPQMSVQRRFEVIITPKNSDARFITSSDLAFSIVRSMSPREYEIDIIDGSDISYKMHIIKQKNNKINNSYRHINTLTSELEKKESELMVIGGLIGTKLNHIKALVEDYGKLFDGNSVMTEDDYNQIKENLERLDHNEG